MARRFARIDSQKKRLFYQRPSDSRESPHNCDSRFLPPRSAIRNKGVQFRNPKTICKNQAIRANLCIDSRESGHLSNFGLVTSTIILECYHSFRNHYILNLKTIKLCNWNGRKLLTFPRGILSCNCILLEKQGNCNCNAK